MKIRTDFVTNSSSSSFIALTLENEVLDTYLKTIGKSLGELTKSINQIFDAMASNGQDFNENFEVKNVAELLIYLITHCAGECDDDCYDSWYGGGLKGFSEKKVEKIIEYINANKNEINESTRIANFHYEWIISDDCSSEYKSFRVKDGVITENIDDNNGNEIVDWRSWMEWSGKEYYDDNFLREKAMLTPSMTVTEFINSYKDDSFKYYILDYKRNKFTKMNSQLQKLYGERTDNYIDADYVIFDFSMIEEWPEEDDEEEFEEIAEILMQIVELKAKGTSSIIFLNNIKSDNCEKILSELTFVVTGALNTFSNRNELKEFIETNGGKLVGSVTSKTDYLITNTPDSGTSKNKMAQSLGVKIITEEQLLKIVEENTEQTKRIMSFSELCKLDKDKEKEVDIAFNNEKGEDTVINFEMLRIGDTISLGKIYENGGDCLDTKCIIWDVIDENEGEILLLTNLACNTIYSHEICSWKKSNIRHWLNNIFINYAFSASEREYIKLTNVRNIIDGNTKDRLYVLSKEEVEKYYPNLMDRKEKLASTYTRTLGIDNKNVICMNESGEFIEESIDRLNIYSCKVAMWIRKKND